MGIGGALLLAAILVRLVRRVRNARRRSGRARPRSPVASRPMRTCCPQRPGAGDRPARRRAPHEAAEESTLLSNSAVMAAGTTISRLSGFVRAALLSYALGASVHADVFNVANTLPNMLYILLAGGVFNAVLVPQLVRSMRNDPDGGDAYTGRVVTVAGLFLLVVTVLLVVAAPLIVDVVTSGYDGPIRESAIAFTRLCLPQVFFYGIYVLVGQILNARGSFGPMMWAPIANNVISVIVVVVYIVGFGKAEGEEVFGPYTTGQEALLGLGATLGIAVQLLILVPYLRRAGFRYRPRLDLRGSGLGHTLRLGIWTVLFVVVNQIAYVVVQRLATGGAIGSPDGTGVHRLLLQLPGGDGAALDRHRVAGDGDAASALAARGRSGPAAPWPARWPAPCAPRWW